MRECALLIGLTCAVGSWQMFHNAAQVAQILFATRTLGLTGQQVGLSYVALGADTVLSSILGHSISRRLGPGPCLVAGIAVTGLGWLLLALVPVNKYGIFAFAFMLFAFGVGAVLTSINFLSLRQAVTPAPMLGRMTSTMRWLILIPAGPGALLGGWLGEHMGLRSSLLFAGVGTLVLSLHAWRSPVLRGVRELPKPHEDEPSLGAEAVPGALTP